MNPPRSRVGLRVGARTLDVAVPAGVPLYEVLREAGVDLDDAHLAVVDSAGRRLDRYSVTGDQLPDGVVLHVVSTARPARAGRRRGPAADGAEQRLIGIAEKIILPGDFIAPDFAVDGTRPLILGIKNLQLPRSRIRGGRSRLTSGKKQHRRKSGTDHKLHHIPSPFFHPDFLRG